MLFFARFLFGTVREFFHHVPVFSEVVFFLVLGDGAVFDGLCGAVADTGHAVGAMIAPDGFAILQGDVVEGAQLHALSAADALLRGVEILRRHFEFAPHRVERQGDEGLKEEYVPGGQVSPCLNVRNDGGELLAGGQNPFPHFLRTQHGIGLAGHVVAGHFELRVSPPVHALLFEDPSGVGARDAAVTTAGENTVDIPAAGEGLLPQVLAEKPGHLAHVDRSAEDEGSLRMQGSVILPLDPIQQVDARVIQAAGNFPGDKFCVAGSGEMQDHRVPP